MDDRAGLEAAVAVGFVALAAVQVACLVVNCAHYTPQICPGAITVSLMHCGGAVMWLFLLLDKSAFVYNMTYWYLVSVSHVAAATAEYRCCDLADCGCTAPTPAYASADCATVLAVLQAGALCGNLSHCCEYDLASCDCGDSALGQPPPCT